jgi:hypothetical protein
MEVEKEPEEKATKATKHVSQAATIAELRDGERGLRRGDYQLRPSGERDATRRGDNVAGIAESRIEWSLSQ